MLNDGLTLTVTVTQADNPNGENDKWYNSNDTVAIFTDGDSRPRPRLCRGRHNQRFPDLG